MIQKNSATVIDWAKHVGLPTHDKPWSLVFCLSTTAHESWTTDRDQLRNEDLRLALSIPSYGHWCVDLRRHDGQFVAQWRPYDDLRIESTSTYFRDELKWPRLQSLFEFPQLVLELQKCLNTQFLSNAQLSSNRDFDLNAWLSHYGTQVKQWLQPCVRQLST